MTDPDYLARLINEQMYAHMERRFCEAGAPMPEADKDRYRWSHPDAVVLDDPTPPLAHAVDVVRCPHCGLTFMTFPRPS